MNAKVIRPFVGVFAGQQVFSHQRQDPQQLRIFAGEAGGRGRKQLHRPERPVAHQQRAQSAPRLHPPSAATRPPGCCVPASPAAAGCTWPPRNSGCCRAPGTLWGLAFEAARDAQMHLLLRFLPEVNQRAFEVHNLAAKSHSRLSVALNCMGRPASMLSRSIDIDLAPALLHRLLVELGKHLHHKHFRRTRIRAFQSESHTRGEHSSAPAVRQSTPRTTYPVGHVPPIIVLVLWVMESCAVNPRLPGRWYIFTHPSFNSRR